MAGQHRFTATRRRNTTDCRANGLDDATPRRERPSVPWDIQGKRSKTSEEAMFPSNASMTPPQADRIISTPPDSPGRQRAFTMGARGGIGAHGCDLVTPPSTPTQRSHIKSLSRGSVDMSFSTLMETGSVPPSEPRSPTPMHVEVESLQGKLEPLVFPHWESGYDISVAEDGSKKLLGSGVWSDVYMAIPQTSPPTEPSSSTTIASCTTTCLSLQSPRQKPTAYAIKTPATRSAHAVLTEESRILSYLTRFPASHTHIITFHGQDPRSNALVLSLMDTTLDGWTRRDLDTLSGPLRATKLALTFPRLALNLLDALAWLHGRGCVHADIKPANVLVETDPASSVPRVVFTDFSSALLTVPADADADADGIASSAHPGTTARGGGTWDFLDPILLTAATASSPSTPSTDLWSLAMTLLVLVLGRSPFDCASSNVFQRREMIKQGKPLLWAAHGDGAVRNGERLREVGEKMGVDLEMWFGGVLGRGKGERVALGTWRGPMEEVVRDGEV